MSSSASPARRRGGTDLTQGSVQGQLFSLGVFIALGVLMMMVTTLADTYFVAQLGTHELAALSFTFPVVMVVTCVAMGLGTGAVSVVSRAVGEGDREAVRALGTDGMLLGVIIVLVLSIAGYATIDPLFRLLGAAPEVLPYIHRYMQIWYLGTIVQIIPQVGSAILRAHGDTKSPSMIMAVASLTNVALDPLLIFGAGPIPALDLEGAALAGIAARVISLIGVLGVMHFRMHALAPVSFRAERIRHSWGKLLQIGLPSTATQLVTPVSMAIITKIIASAGTVAIAAFGVASRIEFFALIYLLAVAGSLGPFVGQNAGAGRMDRVVEAVGSASRFSIAAGAVLAVLLGVAAPGLVSHFSEDPEVVALAVFYLRAVPWSYAPGGLVAVASQTLNSLARPLPASAINLARTIGVTVPLAVGGLWLGGIQAVFVALGFSGLIVGAIAWVWMRRILVQESARRALTPRAAFSRAAE
jgi:putative MATE family efflux protein